MPYPTIEYAEEDGRTSKDVYTILKDLTLYGFYEELNKELEITDRSYDKCQNCSTHIASGINNGLELINLCKQICSIILYIDNIFDRCKDSSGNKPCHYMSHWLYNKVMSITNNTSLIRNFYAAVTIYSGTHQTKLRNCTFTNFEIDKDKFKEKHILYEFLESYDDMKKKIDNKNELYIPLYCKHVKENFNFYNQIKDNCINNTCKYSNDLQNFKNKFSNPEVLNIIYDKCNYEKTLCEKGSNGENDVPCLRERGNSILHLIFGNDTEDIVNVLLKFTTISAPILAFFIILFKFTPLRKSINKLKQEKKKSGHKKKEENIEDYMKNYAAYLDSEMKNRVHLGYHATKM